MVVLTLTDCPPALRGDLSKWLIEIHTGVYVGSVSARVRDALWERVKEYAKNGKATLVYPAKNEQRIAFRVHNTVWKPIDFDGLTLMLHPSLNQLSKNEPQNAGFSKASRFIQARRRIKYANRIVEYPSRYVVVDIETTGLSAGRDEIIEIAAILVEHQAIQRTFQKLIVPKREISPQIESLTGITQEMLVKEGCSLRQALEEFIEFIGNETLVSHNLAFDLRFLEEALESEKMYAIKNRGIDTLSMARKAKRGLKSYQLQDLIRYFKLPATQFHRGLADAQSTMFLFEKLIEFLNEQIVNSHK